MKQFKSIVLTCCKVVLSLLGIAVIGCGTSTSCRVEYGCPHADYEFKGKVVNEKQEPIKGIQVSSTGSEKTLSADDGTFHLIVDSGMHNTIFAEDIDGEENGSYQLTQMEVDVNQTEPGDGDWFYGKFEADDIVIVMKEKQPEGEDVKE